MNGAPGHPTTIIWVWSKLSTMAHIGINATLRDILRDIIYDTLMKKYFTSSGPHRDIIFDNIVSDISSGSVYGICFLTFYSGILSDILFAHYFLAFYLASFLTSYLVYFLASILTFLAFFLIIYLASILTFFPASLLALYHFVLHSIWHSLAYLLILFLAFCLVYLRRFFVVEVWRGILRSRACSWDPAEEGGRGGGGRGGPDDIKSNNPHLTGGEQYPGCIGKKQQQTTHQKHVFPWGDYVRIRFDCFSHQAPWGLNHDPLHRKQSGAILDSTDNDFTIGLVSTKNLQDLLLHHSFDILDIAGLCMEVYLKGISIPSEHVLNWWIQEAVLLFSPFPGWQKAAIRLAEDRSGISAIRMMTDGPNPSRSNLWWKTKNICIQ